MGNRLGIDPNKFKFLSSDGRSTTLQHRDGHKLTIAHNTLSPKNKDALQALSKIAIDDRTPDQASEYGKTIQKADGGQVRTKFAQGEDVAPKTFLGQQIYGTGVSQPKPVQLDRSASDNDSPWPSPSTTSVGQAAAARWQQQQQQMQDSPQGEAEGGKICKACGGPVKRKMYADEDQPVSQNDNAPTAPSGIPDIGGVKKITPALPPPTKEEAIKAKTDEALQNYKSALDTAHNFLFKQPNLEKYYPNEDNTETPPTNAQTRQQPSPSNDEAQIGKEVDAADKYGQVTYDASGNPIAPAGMSDEDINNAPALDDGGPEIQGHTNPAQVSHADQPLGPDGKPVSGNQTGTPQPQVQTPQQQVQPTILDAKNTVSNDLTNHVNSFQNDLDAGHITPKTYSDLFHYNGGDKANGERSTLGKIGSIFGMLLSGMGSGLAHQPNMAFEMMNNQIKNDLEAQQNSVANKQNFLRINQQGLMNQANTRLLDTETGIKARALSNINANQAALHYLNVLANGQGNDKGMGEAQTAFPNVNRQQAQQMLGMVAPMFNAENAKIADLAASKIAYMHQVLGQGTNGNTAGDPATEIRKKQLMGFITPEQAQTGLKEVNNIENMTSANAAAMQAFDEVAKRARTSQYIMHPTQNQKQINALWDPMMDKMVKTNEGRVTPITVDLMNRLKPLATDNEATVALKRDRLNKILYQGMATSALDNIGVPIHKGEPPGQPQGPKQYKEGDQLQNMQTGATIILKNGRWVPIGR